MTKRKLRILFIGHISKAGGVGVHTKNIFDCLIKLNDEILFYDSNFDDENFNTILLNFLKVYRRTLGLAFYAIKMKKSFDIIHIQSSGGLAGFLNALTGSFINSNLLHKKLIVTFHYSGTEQFINRHERLFEYVLKSVDHLILVSHHQEKAIISKFGASKKIHVLPNGYNSRIMRPFSVSLARNKIGLKENIKIMLNIGALEKYKGHEYLIEAMKYISSEDDSSMLYIIGEGSLKNHLQSLIDEYGINNRVILAGGNKPIEEIIYWINACDIFVMSSLNEGNPIVMFESLGCGKPFVGTNVGGISEIISEDKLGILVEPKDAKNLAQAILSGLNNKWNNKYIINYAEQFTWEKIAERTQEIYKTTMLSIPINLPQT